MQYSLREYVHPQALTLILQNFALARAEDVTSHPKIYSVEARLPDNTIVGVLTLRETENIPAVKYIECLCVDEKHRKRGIATGLLNAARQTENDLVLYVDKTQGKEYMHLVKFYCSRGFIPVTQETKYLPYDKKKETMFVSNAHLLKKV